MPDHVDWFSFGTNCQFLLEAINFSLKTATGEEEKKLKAIKENLDEMLLQIKNREVEAGKLDFAINRWECMSLKYLAIARKAVKEDSHIDKVEEKQENEGLWKKSSKDAEVNNATI